jgi:hypothetical protein
MIRLFAAAGAYVIRPHPTYISQAILGYSRFFFLLLARSLTRTQVNPNIPLGY